jgi:hypothetical protein
MRSPPLPSRLPLVAVVALAAASIGAGAAQAAGAVVHSWTWRQQPSPQALEACTATLSKLAAARAGVLILEAPEALAGQVTDLGPALLSFNGRGDFREQQFRWPGRRGVNSCKTGGFPYDEVVTAALIAARDCFPPTVLAIGSDGPWEEWWPGAKLYESVTGRAAVSPLGGDLQEEVPGAQASGRPWVVKRELLDLLPACLLALFLALFLADRFRPRRI